MKKRFFKITSAEFDGIPTIPTQYVSCYIYAYNKRDALRRFNNHVRNKNSQCLNVSTEPLTDRVNDLPNSITIDQIEIIDYPGV